MWRGNALHGRKSPSRGIILRGRLSSLCYTIRVLYSAGSLRIVAWCGFILIHYARCDTSSDSSASSNSPCSTGFQSSGPDRALAARRTYRAGRIRKDSGVRESLWGDGACREGWVVRRAGQRARRRAGWRSVCSMSPSLSAPDRFAALLHIDGLQGCVRGVDGESMGQSKRLLIYSVCRARESDRRLRPCVARNHGQWPLSSLWPGSSGPACRSPAGTGVYRTRPRQARRHDQSRRAAPHTPGSPQADHTAHMLVGGRRPSESVHPCRPMWAPHG